METRGGRKRRGGGRKEKTSHLRGGERGQRTGSLYLGVSFLLAGSRTIVVGGTVCVGVGGALCLAYVSVVVVCAVGVRGVFVGANGGKGDFGERDGGDGGVASEHPEFVEDLWAFLEDFPDGGSFVERLPVWPGGWKSPLWFL